MALRPKRGFTLVELLLSVMILAGAISGVLLLFTTSMISTEEAWDTTVATTHGENILEEMQKRQTFDEIQNANWDLWAAENRFNTLPNEVIEVTLADPGSNPLDVNVKVKWVRKSRVNHIALNTKITK